jgi:hypothetical protein
MRDHVGLAALFVVTLGALVVAGPSRAAAQEAPPNGSIPAATQAALRWLAVMDGGQPGQGWEAAAPPLQQALTKEAWTRAVSEARGPLEPFGPRVLLSAQYAATLPNAAPGPYVVLQYRTKVSQGREVVETVVPMLQPDGSWRVSGYYVRMGN